MAEVYYTDKVTLSDDGVYRWSYDLDMFDELADLRDTINRAIDILDNADERTLLWCRHLENSSWTEIGSRLHVSSRTVHRIHSSALANFSVPD